MLTPKQAKLLAFIKAEQGRNGFSPSYDEIRKHVGGSKGGVCDMIARMEKRGVLKRTPGLARAITIMPQVRPEIVPTVFRWKGETYRYIPMPQPGDQ